MYSSRTNKHFSCLYKNGEEEEENKEEKNNSDNEDNPRKKRKLNKEKKYLDGEPDKDCIKKIDNHIYFYCGVNKKNCLDLNIKLKELEHELLQRYNDFNAHQEYIYLHINSYGGSVFAAFSTIDTIYNLKIPVVSIIEGAAASAGTLISVVCDYRMIYKTSFMLIHQLSSSTWGKMNELEDEMENLKNMMQKIKDIYKKHTRIADKDLDDILVHDLWWDSEKCLNTGLVDEVKQVSKTYKFSSSKVNV